MGRFFAWILLSALLLFAPFAVQEAAQPAFFSLMFPQLMPFGERTPGEAVAL